MVWKNKDDGPHTPSHNLVNRSMGTITTFEKSLETDKVTLEAIHHSSNAFRCEERGKGINNGRASVSEATGTGIHGEVPAEAMGSGIRAHEISSESSGRDLVVVRGVTPSAEASLGVRVEDGRISEVVGIWGPRVSRLKYLRNARGKPQTFGPVPVRLGPVKPALFTQSALEPVHERTMPRQEVSREVHLRSRDDDYVSGRLQSKNKRDGKNARLD